MKSSVDTVGEAQYALVTSFRRDGRAVPTPVWIVRDDDTLLFWTVTASGKVKRIRRHATVLIGPCDVRGKPTGDPISGQAEILDADGTARVRRLLIAKYGLLGRITLWGSRIRRGLDGTIGVRVTPDPPA